MFGKQNAVLSNKSLLQTPADLTPNHNQTVLFPCPTHLFLSPIRGYER